MSDAAGLAVSLQLRTVGIREKVERLAANHDTRQDNPGGATRLMLFGVRGYALHTEGSLVYPPCASISWGRLRGVVF